MQDKDKIIEGLIKSKIEIIADRNERFAMIQEELKEFRKELANKIEDISKKIVQSANL